MNNASNHIRNDTSAQARLLKQRVFPDVDERRSALMAGIRSKNTRPEIIVRRALHAQGLRFRLHSASLPGKPDIILPRHSLAVFVHGCFWHSHSCRAAEPRTRRKYWQAKFAANIARDRKVRSSLRKLGWRVIVIWECETNARRKLFAKIDRIARLCDRVAKTNGREAKSKIR